MGKMSEYFLQLREKEMSNYPLGANEDSNAPWHEKDLGTKDCPCCDGAGSFGESTCCGALIINGVCRLCHEKTEPLRCDVCNGEGKIARTQEDIDDNRKNDIITNSEIKNDLYDSK